jgi:hypothetical protein
VKANDKPRRSQSRYQSFVCVPCLASSLHVDSFATPLQAASMVNVIALLSLLLLSATAPVAWARDDCDQVQIDAGKCDAEASGQAAPDEASADAEPAENSAILSEGGVAGEGEGSQEGRDTGSSVEGEADSVGDASSQPEPSIPPPVATPAPEPALSAPASAAPAVSGRRVADYASRRQRVPGF